MLVFSTATMFQSFFTNHRKSMEFLWNITFRKHRKYFFMAIAAVVTERTISILIPYLSKFEMDQLVMKSSRFLMFSKTPFGIFVIILTAIFLANLLQSVTQFAFDFVTKTEKARLENDLALSIYRRIHFLDPGLSLSARYQRLIDTMREVATSLPNQLEKLLIDKFGLVITLISTFLIFSAIDIWLFVIVLFSAVISYLIDRGREALTLHFNLERSYEMDSLSWNIKNILQSSYHHIVANGASDKVIGQLESVLETMAQDKRKQAVSEISMNIGNILNQDLMEFAIKAYVGYSIYYATGSIGLMTMTVMYTKQIRNVIHELFRSWIDRNQMIDDLAKLELFLSMTSKSGQDRTEDILLPIKHISLENVTFQYPKAIEAELDFINIEIKRIESYKRRESWRLDELHILKEAKAEIESPNPVVLLDIDLRFEQGKIYGIVGKNGAGKTTLINLLLGFFSTYEGSIRYNDLEGRKILYNSFHSLASYVSQEPFIMKGKFTIRDNLTLGVQRSVTDEELWGLLDTFHIRKKVEKMRLGLESYVGWDVDLSGGQRQILSIIRTILQDRPILILDE